MPTPTLLQSITTASAGAATSLGATFGSSCTNGSTIIAMALAVTGGSPTLAASDPTNGSYTADNTCAGSVGGIAMSMLRFSNNSATTALTVTMTSTTSVALRLIIEEWSNISTSAPVDQVTAAVSSTGTSMTGTATGTLAQVGEVIIAFGAATSALNWTAGAGFTPDPNISFTGTGRVAEYIIPANTNAVTPTFTGNVSSQWTIMAAAYKPVVLLSPAIILYDRKYVHYYST